jgi:amino acid adenylation domain-containing protein
MARASVGRREDTVTSPFMTTLDEINRLTPEKKRALLEQLLREKAGQPAPAPLSSGQERLWFLDRLQPNTPLYNIPTALRLIGELDANALKDALSEIVRRHESLRTTFATVEGAPVQKVNPPSEVPFAIVDISQAANGSRDAEMRRHIREISAQPFDLSRDVMIRAKLIRLAPNEHALVLVAHHIAADEWSLRVLFKELSLLYEARMTGREMALPELPIQYSDYAEWQREFLQSPTYNEHLDCWRKHLAGCTPNLELPSDHPRTNSAAHRGKMAFHFVQPQTLEAIKGLSRRENATLFMTLLAAFNVLLHRYTRQEDILVGSPIAGRTRTEMEELIGFFVNTIVLRSQLRDDMPFTDLLKQVRETTLGAYAHQDVPFEKLVENLQPERNASGSSLVQVMFAFESGYVNEQLLPGLRVEPIDAETGTAKFDLTFVTLEEHGGLRLIAEYDSDLFSAAMIERLLGHFENLLTSIAAQPERPIAKHEFIGEAEKKRLLIDWNKTQRPYPRNKSIPELIDEVVATRANAPAISYNGVTMSYADLNARANQVASRLRRAGVTRGGFVGLLMEPSCEAVVAMLGIMKAGAAYVPLDPAYPQDRLAFMLRDAGAKITIAHQKLSNLVGKGATEFLFIDATFKCLRDESAENASTYPEATDVAYVIYTSGSTGVPKGLCVAHRSVARLVRNTDYVDIKPTDVIAQGSSQSFDASIFEIWGALINGAKVAGIKKDDLINAKSLSEILRKERVSIIFVTTALFNQLASEAPGIFEPLRYVFFGGEACNPKAVASVLKDGPPQNLGHVYGPTETTVFATHFAVREVHDAANTIPIGHTIANTTGYIVDAAGNLAPIGVPGELWLGGDGVAVGYLNRPELTREKFITDRFSGEPGARLYRTGDLVRRREDGAIEFLGRIDNQVKIRGFRIELGEVESALLKHAAVRKAAVLAREDKAGDKKLVAYVEPNPGQAAESADLKSYLKQSLPDFMVPSAFVTLDHLPLSPNGKIDRKSLPAPEWKTTERIFQAAADEIEQKIAKIWEHTLGVQPIGVTDNFFDLGGHSLLAVKVFAQFEKVFERKLPLATLFKAPTIRQLAEIVRGESKPQAWSTVVDIQPKGSKKPIFWAHSLGGDGGGGFFYYRRLATLLGEDQPSFGIRSPQQPFERIEDMAAYYIREIKAVQPEGPYQLGGFCFGGIVAYEMARQLEAAGDKLSLLAVLESAPPNLEKLHARLPRSARFSIENVYENLRDFVSHSPTEQVAMVKRKARKVREKLSHRNGDGTAQPPPALKDLIDMSKYPKDYVKYAETHWKALESYVPGLYGGTVHLFRARKQPLRITDPSLGWNIVAPGRVKIEVIPGTHETMVTEPHVQVLAQKVINAIQEAAAA